MSLIILPANEALSPGAGLWILADLESSRWARDLDWNLAFQLKRATLHVKSVFAGELESIMEKWQFTAPPPEGERKNLMIASEFLLPNKMTVQVPFAEDSRSWIAQCKQVWDRLDRPEVRIFLPDNLSSEVFSQNWKVDHEPTTVQLVSATLSV